MTPPRLLFAVLIIAIGGILLLTNLGAVSATVWEVFWPLVIIAIGVSLFWARDRTRLHDRRARHEQHDD